MQRFNDFLAGYCERRGRVLIDPAPYIAPRTAADLGKTFIDFIHPAPAAYDALALCVSEAIAPLVASAQAGA
jgi:hypothetical protein